MPDDNYWLLLLDDNRSGQAHSIQIYGHITNSESLFMEMECDTETSNFIIHTIHMTEEVGHYGGIVNGHD